MVAVEENSLVCYTFIGYMQLDPLIRILVDWEVFIEKWQSSMTNAPRLKTIITS